MNTLYHHTDEAQEAQLVAKLIDGDKEAFCRLYSMYKERLTFFALKFLKSSDYAEDVVQDAFTYLWMGRRFIHPDTSFSAYLYTIVRNRVFNQLRTLAQQQLLEEHLLKNAVDYTESTQEEILTQDLRESIHKAFETLTPRQQEIFRLSREGRLSYKEIADRLEISVSTVHEHITLSLHAIRKYLVKHEGIKSEALLTLLLFCLH